MQVLCPSCQSQIPSEDMSLANLVAKCRICHDLIDLSPLLPGNRVGGAPIGNTDRARIPRPPGLKVDDSGPGLKIVKSWFTSGVFIAVLFCIAWDSFLVFWYSVVIAGNAPWLFVVFPICHVAVGIGLTYSTLAGLINRTVIEVDEETLTVWHGPLPSFGNRSLPTESLDQLYTQPVSEDGKRGVTESYNLCAATKDGHKVILLAKISDIDESLFIEQAVEAYLGIKHRPMPGEAS